MPSAQQPRFVVFEGLDGAGTTTQTTLLAERLREVRLRACATAEPSDGPIGGVLRRYIAGELELDPLSAALGFVADRADHLTRVIRPALERGQWVVCDRYVLSTLAYQGSEGVDRGWLMEVSAGIDVPDATFFLEVGEAQLAERLKKRDGVDRYEAPGLVDRIRLSYEASIALVREQGHYVVVLDGTADPAEIARAVLAELDSLAAHGV